MDLWGGYRIGLTRAPWEEDTLVPVLSTTKGVASMALAVAHSRGLIDYDARVADHWPEFAANGKERITVRQLLSHQAGLCAIDEKLDLHDLLDLDRIAGVIARQEPKWEPGTRHGYHAITLGWYEGELIRKVDPQGRSLGRFFAEEVARPLGVEFYIGLPDAVPDERIATIHGYKPAEMLLHLHEFPPAFVFSFLNPWSVTYRTFGNPRILGLVNEYNRRELVRAEIPASSGVGRVRDIARAYGEFATGGPTLGLTGETLDALSLPAVAPSARLAGASRSPARSDRGVARPRARHQQRDPFGCGTHLVDRGRGAPGCQDRGHRRRPGPSRAKGPGPFATSGRGLRWVDALADDWGVAPRQLTHVWFQVPLEGEVSEPAGSRP